MSLTDRLKKAVKIDNGVKMLDEVKDVNPPITTECPMLNVALNGRVDGGLKPGVTIMAGEEQTFKTNYGILLMKAFQTQYPDGIVLFYDNEGGATPEYFATMGVDPARVLVIPIANIEEMQFNMVSQLDEITLDDKVFIMVDSIGQMASKKELEDALAEKSVVDLTRAKSLKSLYRLITPYINMKGVYTYFIAHTYKSMGSFIPTDVVAGGKGLAYAANFIGIVSRAKEKEGSDYVGNRFTIKVEKSRFVRRESKIPVVATFEDGVMPYSGLSDIAEECGIIEKVRRRGIYLVFGDKEIKEKDSTGKEAKAFWDAVFANSDLGDCIAKKYLL